MPANRKHLTKSPWQRFAKISAGFIGGYLVTQTFHMLLIQWWNPVNAIITLQFVGFALWLALLILAFLAKNGWKTWCIYLLLTFIMGILIYLNPTLFK
ncbi:hypothetical protein SAMN04487911_10322 [Arenibacter nanhaiticus]|uniref:Uncharacterized protein n=1 Tax=Arenibacter nanhaiticus TaxID=558155 RepID=A0A1M6BYU2_9FLAO|nr:hypothetical protein [Arenibacter nanhaiticus]SHI53813.1 hypothetical protein SAMN04487911_10322 [Arenibacter nanhaiticus]